MRSARLGSLNVSVVGLGCNNFGRALDQNATNEVVNAAIEAGMNFFDTASNYGNGQSERFLGKALGTKRDKVVVASKFGMPVPGINGSGGAKPRYIRESLERSLAELGTDRIDLFQLHRPDPEIPIADTLGVLSELIQEGKVLEIGCSNLDVTQTAEAYTASEDNGLNKFVSNQIEYSMVHREPETSGLTTQADQLNIAILPFYPLASGLLTGKKRKGEEAEGRLNMDRYQRFLTNRNYEITEGLRGFAGERGLTMAAVAISWLLAQSSVPSVTPGATKAEQITSNASASNWIPTPAELDVLDHILEGQ